MRTNRGNILFLILLAVVLFAALAYAVTSSMRGGGKNANAENADTLSSQIAQYGALLENTVNQLQLVNDCKNEQLSLENTVVSGYTNNNAPSSKKCHLFDTAGGGASFGGLSAPIYDPGYSSAPGYGQIFFSSQTMLVNAGCNSPAQSCTDLVMLVPYVNADVCRSFNKSLIGVTTIPSSGSPYDGGSFGGCKMSGFNWCGGAYPTGSTTFPYGTKAGCVSVPVNGSVPAHNVIFYLLLAR